MKVTHYFTASLTAPTPAVLYAVKGDGARMAVIRLMAGAEPWPVPEGVTAGVSYTLPDKTPGYYDRLEDGAPACMIAGNLVSAVIAPVLTGQAGTVKASIVLRDPDGGQVATFPFQLRVEPAPGIVDAESVPAMGNGFEGKLFYGGPGGALTALALGDGVRVETTEDGTLALVAEGGSGGGGGIDEEKDPTVPAWAKQPQKPAYTAQEVGALPAGTKIPGKTSDLTNDAGFVNKAVNDLTNYYTRQQTQELIAAIPRFRVTVVQQLPAAGEELVLYLVPFATAEGQYLEFIWVDGRWEIIGSQRVNLTGYATEEWVQEYVEEHSGQNVEIDTTLTQSGKAADAKAVGDALDKLEEKIPSIEGLAKTEDIPDVPSWAMQASKPTYTASEVGALPNTYTPPNQTAEQVGADPKGTAASAVSAHNTNTNAHNDIRQELAAINARLTAFFDSDNQTLDELSEIVAYITSNKSLIDAITTSKVSVADIVNNLTTNVANKPLSAAQGVVIKTLLDGLSTGKLDASALTESINTALAQAKASGEFDGEDGAPGTDGNDGYTPKRGVDYWTPDDIAAIDADIATELAKRAQLRPEPAESLEWLAENGDQSKIYVLPNGNMCMWLLTEKEVSSGGGYTNALDGTTKNINKRWSRSSKALSVADGYMTTDKLPVSAEQMVYVNLPRDAFLGNYARIHYVDASGNYVTQKDSAAASNHDIKTDANGVSSWKVGYETATTNDMSTVTRLPNADNITHMIVVFNISNHVHGSANIAITEADVAGLVVSIGNPIEEGGTTIVKEYAWVDTGLNITPADYEPRIIALEKETAQNTSDINALKKGAVDTGGVDALTWIRNWDSPIYDRVPVFQLTEENPAVTAEEKTVGAVYAKYDALMAANSRYITKTDMGMCSDGVTPVYRYDFREPEPHHQSGMQWSETKPTIIIVSGIHGELGGIYSLYYALKEITENPELDDLRRNVHFVVVPVMNPYCMIGPYNTTFAVQNANGVEIHRNFEVGFKYPGESGYIEPGNRSHGGTEPLSEVESQYIDNLFKEFPDAALFMTCHSAQRDTRWGTGFIWASTATEYTCNLGYRLVDKMSKAWHKKYGSVWEEGCVRENNYVLANPSTYPNGVQLEDGDYRAGHAHVSSTNGTETRQATKYGIQGANVEVLDTFWVLSSTALDSKLTTHGAEVYINYLLMYMGCYDHKDKRLYAPGV